MGTNKSSFVKTVKLNRLSVWDKFKQDNPKYAHIDSKELRKNMQIFFDEVGNLITERQDGLILNMIGYFANPSYRKKTFMEGYNEATKKVDNILTQGFIYEAAFFPHVFKKSPLRLWLFSINRLKARKMAREIIDNGVRYRCHTTFLKNIVKDKKYLFTEKN
jgi:hypothetical protein